MLGKGKFKGVGDDLRNDENFRDHETITYLGEFHLKTFLSLLLLFFHFFPILSFFSSTIVLWILNMLNFHLSLFFSNH